MKARPILMQPDMVQATLREIKQEGTGKTQTRRLLKNPEYYGCPTGDCPHSLQEQCNNYMNEIIGECPYGKIGDLLWVRESCYIYGHWHTYIDWKSDGKERRKFIEHPDKKSMYVEQEPISQPPKDGLLGYIKRPSIFMPRWASRITLEIIDIRVERLRDISRGDCISEGCPFPNIAKKYNPVKWFSDLWKSINGKDSWDANPWVWVIEFKPHLMNVDNYTQDES